MPETQHADTETPWHAAFPAPLSTADYISREEMLRMLYDSNQNSAHTFLAVDLRRVDHEGGTIRGSLNLPAQSLWYSLDTLYELCNAAGIIRVIFYCGWLCRRAKIIDACH